MFGPGAKHAARFPRYRIDFSADSSGVTGSGEEATYLKLSNSGNPPGTACGPPHNEGDHIKSQNEIHGQPSNGPTVPIVISPDVKRKLATYTRFP